ncbi:MAG: peptidylprolyl isomerase, partial [Lachnospiraceae bacterium]|nr:peptidylprolyl isomerase [Lachnospiraceae bacterium]
VVAADYNETAESDMTFGRGTLPPEVDKVAFQMEDGQVSECISTDDGYYFLQCVNKYNQELTDSNKSRIVRKREQEAFDAEYDAFVADLSSDLNENVWKELKLQTDGSITTNSYFTVFDRYFGAGK